MMKEPKELFTEQDRAAEVISTQAPIHIEDARALVYLCIESLNVGVSFDKLAEAICHIAPGSRVAWCSNREKQ